MSQAEALARQDEASLGALEAAFFEQQSKAVGRGLLNCGVTSALEASGIKVVMRLDAEGRVTKTWLNEPTELGQCFEKQLRSAVLPTDGRPEFYTFIGFNF